VNSGGEPERDDTGLPPVDIEIPDDARDLDRDVQAYYRELRPHRRRQRRLRLHGTLARDGIVLPLLACCLVLALITGTLLTIFTATSDQDLTRVPGLHSTPGTGRAHTPDSGASSAASASRAAASRAASASASASAGSSSAVSASPSKAAGQPVPQIHTTAEMLNTGSLTLAGNQTIPFASLSGTMLVLIPPACHCAATVSWLAGIGVGDRAPTYLVGTPATAAQTNRLYAGLTPAERADVAVATEPQDELEAAVPVSGLAVLLIAPTRLISYAEQLSTADNPRWLVQALNG
jgi:hypothetical protein